MDNDPREVDNGPAKRPKSARERELERRCSRIEEELSSPRSRVLLQIVQQIDNLDHLTANDTAEEASVSEEDAGVKTSVR